MTIRTPQWYRERFPFEYCASHYLKLWESEECELCTRFEQALVSGETPTSETIKRALTHFRIARNFKGIAGRHGELWPAIQNAVKTPFSEDALDKRAAALVANTEQAWQGDFPAGKISAASKLLWLAIKQPFVIYDTQAVLALSEAYASNHKLDAGDGRYERYLDAWRKEYAAVSEAIASAIRQLPEGKRFMPKPHTSDEQILQFAELEWFKERVFDTFLWLVGGEHQRHSDIQARRKRAQG